MTVQQSPDQRKGGTEGVVKRRLTFTASLTHFIFVLMLRPRGKHEGSIIRYDSRVRKHIGSVHARRIGTRKI